MLRARSGWRGVVANVKIGVVASQNNSSHCRHTNRHRSAHKYEHKYTSMKVHPQIMHPYRVHTYHCIHNVADVPQLCYFSVLQHCFFGFCFLIVCFFCVFFVFVSYFFVFWCFIFGPTRGLAERWLICARPEKSTYARPAKNDSPCRAKRVRHARKRPALKRLVDSDLRRRVSP